MKQNCWGGTSEEGYGALDERKKKEILMVQ